MSSVPSETIGSRRLHQGVVATWWYTASGVLSFQVIVGFVWLTVFTARGVNAGMLTLIGAAGLAWCASSVLLLLRYRHRDDGAGPIADWPGILLPIIVAVGFGALCGIVSGLWVFAVLPVVQTVMLLNWPRGVRLRLVLTSMVLLAALWFIDGRTTIGDGGVDANRGWWAFGIVAVGLPSMTVLSLWWWDVLVALDRARVAEARLGATQERLRVATDVHDLQGHHLQVVALQLELAERLLEKDPDAALEQLRMARTSVAEARQGTRDLATRFRGVPLPDEIANARDLLQAAGTAADARIAVDAERAPASVLGPVIRETTTNALRHGGGRWARLSLTRADGSWRYTIANDAASEGAAGDDDGSGLEGIRHRVAEAGGEVHVERGRGEFHVHVTIPDAGSEPHGGIKPAAVSEPGPPR